MKRRFAGPVVLLLLGAFPRPCEAVQAASNPHGPLPPGLACEDCHTEAAWTPLRDAPDFVHGERSGFELTGAHQDADCAGCHLDLRFDAPRIGPLECQACHQDPHQGRLVDACASCHTTTRTFYEVDGELAHARTALPLTGAHLQVPCETCHVEDRVLFTGLDPDCISCHLDAYRASPVVDHEAGGFSTDCTRCHSDLGWADSPLFDHEQASGWPLVDIHAGVRCSGCHQLPGMEPLFPAQSPDDCVACHQDDHDAVHGVGFPTACTDCHTQTTWSDWTFDHDAVGGFPLLGRHAGLACMACHDVPGYDLLFPAPSDGEDCVACHRADYDREHGVDGTPTTCALCHGVENWDSDFRHDADYFPIYSGSHAERWADCAECHVAAGDFSTFSCIDCHQHNPTDTDARHLEVPGYVYESGGCYACHSRGD
ncbi:MAG TPA: hypothetical protein VK858_07725 [Longimicrobiales bacterium]|nr:hypothetical protein [Longimicrobiales bacterium]